MIETTKTVYWLSVFMWIEGAWIPGNQVEGGGWSPRSYETLEICEMRQKSAEIHLSHAEVLGRKVIPTYWVCNEAEPLNVPPADLLPPS